MIKIEFTDGGPAHPLKVEMKAGDTLRMGGKSVTLEEGHTEVFQGISKREYFAAAALQGWAAGRSQGDCFANTKNTDPAYVAESCFKYADAMLAESDKKV